MTSSPSPARSTGPTVLDGYEDPVTDEEALLIYRWLDSIEFTRSKKMATNRDFSDAVMMAELVAHYVPKICNATFYVPTSAQGKKIENWNHLNQKVFRRIGFQFTPELIQKLATARVGVIERVLKEIRPTLLLGHRAVIPTTQKKHAVKSRLMDYEKTKPKATPERPSSAVPKTKSSAVKTKPKAPRPRTAVESGRVETPVAETAPVPPPEQKIQDANENYAETKLAEAEEYDSLPLKAEPDIIVDDNCEVSAGTAVTKLEEDQPIDIICSPLETVDQRPGSPRQLPYGDDSMDQVEAELTRRGKRFKKQIIKYEYKEEFVVSGTANFQLPPSQLQVNTATKNGGPHVMKGGYYLV